MDEENVPLGKELIKLPCDNLSQENLLERPGPLGLRLTKTDSFLDAIQRRLSQQNSSSIPSITRGESHETVHTEKVKASNFSVSLLRIGSWERVSRREGDLVGKFYFAKHKLLWEVLDGSLKSKIEFQSSEITALKATLPEDGPGTLDIVLARPPLFFKEMIPQPRRHIAWKATSDFTGGEASRYRRHFLQCPQGSLNVHFEKLIRHDPHLRALSEQPTIVVENPYFDQSSPFEGNIETLEDLRNLLMNDFHVTCAADERFLMSKVSSLCDLLQVDPASIRGLDDFYSNRSPLGEIGEGEDGRPGSSREPQEAEQWLDDKEAGNRESDE